MVGGACLHTHEPREQASAKQKGAAEETQNVIHEYLYEVYAEVCTRVYVCMGCVLASTKSVRAPKNTQRVYIPICAHGGT